MVLYARMPRQLRSLSAVALLLIAAAPTGKAVQATAAPNGSAPPAALATGRATLDATLAKLAAQHLFSGSVLVALHGAVVLSKGYGYADSARKLLNGVTTEFTLASITKQFTAAAVLQLQEAGKLSVHDRLCRYISACPRAWAPITLQQLLTHTSGIADYLSLQPDTAVPTTTQRQIDALRPLPLHFMPGARYEYSNSNYLLLGSVIATVAREPYAEYVQQHILDPLHLQRTGFDTTDPDVRTHAVGYTSWATPAPHWDTTWNFGDGALYSSVVDLWHWDQALAGSTILSKTSTAAMFTGQAVVCKAPVGGVPCDSLGPRQIDYGYAWDIATVGKHALAWHTGRFYGFTGITMLFPREGTSIIVLSNLESSNISHIAYLLIEIVLGMA